MGVFWPGFLAGTAAGRLPIAAGRLEQPPCPPAHLSSRAMIWLRRRWVRTLTV